MKEWKTGRFQTQKQALAVAYSMVRKKHPRCVRPIRTIRPKSKLFVLPIGKEGPQSWDLPFFFWSNAFEVCCCIGERGEFCVGVSDAVFEGVLVGVSDAVLDGVFVGVSEEVLLGVFVIVFVGVVVGVVVGVCVTVGVDVEVGVGVFVFVSVAVGVEVKGIVEVGVGVIA